MSTYQLTETSYSAFANHTEFICSRADLHEILDLTKSSPHPVTIFDDFSGRRTELEPNAEVEQVLWRLNGDRTPKRSKKSGPGRPKLGVQSREISLLPRHWDWLAQQSGGASAALRRLVEQARKQFPAREAARQALDAIAMIMTVLAGDEPGYEEASRSLYAGRFDETLELIEPWLNSKYFQRLVSRAEDLRRLADLESAEPECSVRKS